MCILFLPFEIYECDVVLAQIHLDALLREFKVERC